MKTLGIWCRVVGVALVVFGDQINRAHPHMLWLWAGVFIVMGFVYFNRKWSENIST
jgi:hypothetical protein